MHLFHPAMTASCTQEFNKLKTQLTIPMKLTRFQPYNRLANLAEFDQWLRQPFSAFDSLIKADTPPALAVDVFEDEQNYFARYELPGAKKENVKVELHEGQLTVSVHSHQKEGDTEQSLLSRRVISVPDTLRADAITAKLEDGVLTVTLPKPEERKPRTIELS